MAFGDCQNTAPAPLTPDEICNGFAKCGQPGMRLNPANITRVIRYLESLTGIDIDALAAALCANATFQACVAGLTTPSTHTVVSIAAVPAAGVEGTQFCWTITLDSPVAIAAVEIPVALSGDEQIAHGYVISSPLVIPVGATSATICVATIDDGTDEPDLQLTMNFGATPRIPGWPGGASTVIVGDNDIPVISAPPETNSFGDEGAPLISSYGTFTVSDGAHPWLTFTAVPAGVTFTDNGDGTYGLAGVFPTYPGGGGGFAQVTVTANYPDAIPVSIFHNLISDEVAGNAPSFTQTTPSWTGHQGHPLSFTSAVVNGSQPMTLTATGVPSGMTFTDNGNGTYTLSGPYGEPGNHQIDIVATNAFGSATLNDRPMTIYCQLLELNGYPYDFSAVEGTTFSHTFGPVAGTPLYSGYPDFQISNPATYPNGDPGSVPAGVTFTDNGDGTFTVAGVMPPFVSSPTEYRYYIQVDSDCPLYDPSYGPPAATTIGILRSLEAGGVAPVAPAGAPFTDTGVAGEPITPAAFEAALSPCPASGVQSTTPYDFNFGAGTTGTTGTVSYLWSVTAIDGGGTWSVQSGQGTAAAVIRVTGIPFGSQTTATVSCAITDDNDTVVVECDAVFDRT